MWWISPESRRLLVPTELSFRFRGRAAYICSGCHSMPACFASTGLTANSSLEVYWAVPSWRLVTVVSMPADWNLWWSKRHFFTGFVRFSLIHHHSTIVPWSLLPSKACVRPNQAAHYNILGLHLLTRHLAAFRVGKPWGQHFRSQGLCNFRLYVYHSSIKYCHVY